MHIKNALDGHIASAREHAAEHSTAELADRAQ